MAQIIVGTLRVDLVANTATFTPGLDEAAKKARQSKEKINRELDGVDFSEARGALALLGEDIGIKLPRHVRSFVAELPGVSTALAGAFSAVAIVSLVMALAEAYEKFSKMAEATQKAKEKFNELNTQILEQGNRLMQNTLKIDDQIRVLQGLKPKNALTLALLESTNQADALWKSLDKVIEEASKALQAESVSRVTAFFTGKTQTDAMVGAYQSAIHDITRTREEGAAKLQEAEMKEADILRRGTDQQKKDALERIKAVKDEWEQKVDRQIRGARQMAQIQLEHLDQAAKDEADKRAIGEADRAEFIKNYKADKQKEAREATEKILELTTSITYVEQQSLENQKAIVTQATTHVYKIIDLTNQLKGVPTLMDRWRQIQQNIADGARDEKSAYQGVLDYMERARDLQQIASIEEEEKLRHVNAAQRERDAALAEQDIRLQESLGLLSAHEAAEKKLALYTKEKQAALDDYADELKKIEPLLQRYSNITLGGIAGSPEDKAIFDTLQKLYLKLKQDQFRTEKEWNGKIAGARGEMATGFKADLNKWAQDNASKAAVFKKLGDTFMQTVDNMSSALTKFLVEGEGDWKSFAAAAIESFVQIGVQALMTWAVMKLLAAFGIDTKKQQKDQVEQKKAANTAIAQSDAGTAAANTFAMYSATMMLPAAVAMSGLAYGIGMAFAGLAKMGSFEKGGVIPNTGIALVHKGEGVFPAPVTNALMRMAQDSIALQPQDRRTANVTYAPQFSVWDRNDVAGALDKHRDVVKAMVRRELARV